MRRDTHRQERYVMLCPAPPGLVAVYVDGSECLTDPVVAFGIREVWESPTWRGHPFDPDRDTDYETEPVCLVIEDGYLSPATDTENCVGVFPAAELTDARRATLAREYQEQQRQLEQARAARQAAAAAKS